MKHTRLARAMRLDALCSQSSRFTAVRYSYLASNALALRWLLDPFCLRATMRCRCFFRFSRRYRVFGLSMTVPSEQTARLFTPTSTPRMPAPWFSRAGSPTSHDMDANQ